MPPIKGALSVISTNVKRITKLNLDLVTFESNEGQPIFLIPYEEEMAASLYIQNIQQLVFLFLCKVMM